MVVCAKDLADSTPRCIDRFSREDGDARNEGYREQANIGKQQRLLKDSKWSRNLGETQERQEFDNLNGDERNGGECAEADGRRQRMSDESGQRRGGLQYGELHPPSSHPCNYRGNRPFGRCSDVDQGIAVARRD